MVGNPDSPEFWSSVRIDGDTGTTPSSDGEEEIAGHHCEVGRLRAVTANRNAVSFYLKRGRRIEREFRHETLPIEMLELAKRSVRT